MDKEKNDEINNKIIIKKINCDCNKPRFQKEVKKDCTECMYYDLLYIVP